MKNENQNNSIIIYEGKNGQLGIEVRLEDETVWLSQQQLAELYQSSRTNIVEHIKHIYEEGELDELATCRNFRQVRTEGSRRVERELPFYNLDLIISLGYRVKSHIATKFRIWATARLKEYIIKGFTMDDERLKNLGGGKYWYELLERIRDIRSSEKVLYRQVLDLYATAIDYDPQTNESLKFFKIVQNKLHFAAHGYTAAEVIYLRVDSDKPFAGLTNFKGKQPIQAEAMIAKNFLKLSELKVLNNLVSAYFDLAEVKAMNREPMYMQNWITQLDKLIGVFDKKVLTEAGPVSHTDAMKKAEAEYKKYQTQNLSEVEKSYLDTIKTVQKKIEKKVKDQKPKQKKKP